MIPALGCAMALGISAIWRYGDDDRRTLAAIIGSALITWTLALGVMLLGWK